MDDVSVDGTAGRDRRPARPQRRRQDHDAADAGRHPLARSRAGAGRRPRRARRADRRQAADRLPVGRHPAVSAAHAPGGARLLRPALRARPGGHRDAQPRPHRRAGHGRLRRPPLRHAVVGPEAARQRRPRLPPRSAGAHPRRAHQRPRRGERPVHRAGHPAGPRRRPGGAVLDAHHGRGRVPLRPDRAHPPGPGGRCRAAAPTCWCGRAGPTSPTRSSTTPARRRVRRRPDDAAVDRPHHPRQGTARDAARSADAAPHGGAAGAALSAGHPRLHADRRVGRGRHRGGTLGGGGVGHAAGADRAASGERRRPHAAAVGRGAGRRARRPGRRDAMRPLEATSDERRADDRAALADRPAGRSNPRTRCWTQPGRR